MRHYSSFQITCILAAAGIAGVSCTALSGWARYGMEYAFVSGGFGPMHPASAILFLCVALSLMGLAGYLSQGFMRLQGIFIALTAFLMLGQKTIWPGYSEMTLYGVTFSVMMSFHTALTFFITGVALILCAPDPSSGRRSSSYLIVIASSVAVAMAASRLLGHLSGVELEYPGQLSVHMSVQTSCCFIIANLVICAYAWRVSVTDRLWLPLPVGIALITISISVSQAVRSQEDSKFAEMIQTEANHIASKTQLQLTDLYRSLDRIGTLWNISQGMPTRLAQADAATYLRDYSFLSAISYADRSLKVQWARPEPHNRKAPGHQIDSEPGRYEAVHRAIETHHSQTSRTLKLPEGGKGVLYYIPLYAGDRLDGVMTAMFQIDRLFGSMLDANDRNFYVQIQEDGQVYSSLPGEGADSRRWKRSASIQNKSGELTVTVSPGPAILAMRHTLLPYVVLGVGLFMSILVTLCVFLTFGLSLNVKWLGEITAFQNTIIDNSPYAIIVTDIDGIIQTFNPAAEQMLGYLKTELLGKERLEIFHDPDEMKERALQISQEHDDPVAPGMDVFTRNPLNNGLEEREWTHIRKDGTRLTVLMSVVPRYNAQGDVIGFLSIARDITERKQVEKMKNEFISTVSHELRTPLTSIRGSLGLIVGNVAGNLPDKMRSLIEIAYKNSGRLVRLINNILDIEKIESGRMAFEKRPVSVNNVLHHAVEEAEGYAARYDVGVVLSELEKDVMIWGDSDRLLQVLSNLISNAVKHSFSGGEVRIFAHLENRGVHIGVQDNGSGVPEEFMGRIFGKFAQADSSDTRQKGGTGLGLSISKAIIESMNGRIDVHSTPGNTVFHFVLPQMRDASKGQPAFMPPEGERRILVCEDDPEIAEMLRVLLDSEGFDVSVATTALDAKRLLVNQRFSAMTLDLNLSDQNGLALIHDLRQFGPTEDLPIIVISARSEEGKSQLNGEAVGVVDWLSKPVDVKVLRHALQSLPGKRPHLLHVENDADIASVMAIAIGSGIRITCVPTLKEARHALENQTFDLTVLDLDLPDGNGAELLTELAEKTIPVIILSATETPQAIQDLVRASLIKSVTSERRIVSTVQTILARKHRLG